MIGPGTLCALTGHFPSNPSHIANTLDAAAINVGKPKPPARNKDKARQDDLTDADDRV
jgi:hypothetical protein